MKKTLFACAENKKRSQMAEADLIDLYEAKSLDGDVLAEIARSLFSIAVLS